MQTRDHFYEDNGVSLKGYLALPDSPTPAPGIVVFPELFGLGEHAMGRARMLADLGYVALAADMYGDRAWTSDIPAARKMNDPLVNPPTKLRARAMAAVNVLAGLPQVDSSRLGAIGYCFGGATVIELAHENDMLAGVVSFHGGLKPRGPVAQRKIKTKILVCCGANDPVPGALDFDGFQAQMRETEADYQIIIYGGAGHSFTDKYIDKEVDAATRMSGVAYDPSADARSWQHMRDFFDEVLA